MKRSGGAALHTLDLAKPTVTPRLLRDNVEAAYKVFLEQFGQEPMAQQAVEQAKQHLKALGKRRLQEGWKLDQEVKLGPLSASDPKTAPMGSKPPDFAEAKRKVRAWKETLAK